MKTYKTSNQFRNVFHYHKMSVNEADTELKSDKRHCHAAKGLEMIYLILLHVPIKAHLTT